MTHTYDSEQVEVLKNAMSTFPPETMRGSWNHPDSLTKISDSGTRQVYAHEDVPDYVVKTATESGTWANESEIEISTQGTRGNGDFVVPDVAMDHIAHVVEYDHGPNDADWIIMERADMDSATEEGAKEIWSDLRDVGWGVSDLHMDNVGVMDGDPVLVDYVYLKPISEMLPKPRRRVESGKRWE